MISLQQIRSFFLTMSLAVILATTIAFGFGSPESWAATSPVQALGQPQAQMLAMNPIQEAFKNIEGQAQETFGKVTDNPKAQVEGDLKQAESKASSDVGKLKDKASNDTQTLKDKAKEILD